MRSEAIVNITSEPQNFTADDVSITTFVIQELTKDAIVNPEVCEVKTITVTVIIFIHSGKRELSNSY